MVSREPPSQEQVVLMLASTSKPELLRFIDAHKDGWTGPNGAIARALAAVLDTLNQHCK